MVEAGIGAVGSTSVWAVNQIFALLLSALATNSSDMYFFFEIQRKFLHNLLLRL